MSDYVKFRPDVNELSLEEERKLRDLIGKVVNPRYLQEAQDRDTGRGGALRENTHPGFAESEQAMFEIFKWKESLRSEIYAVLERLIRLLAGQYINVPRVPPLTGDAAERAQRQAFEEIKALLIGK